MKRYANKRLMVRKSNGRFRKATMQDIGIGGVCQTCRHFLQHTYDGDPRDTSPDPRKFRYRCFTCEPETPDELALKAEIEAERPKARTIFDVLAAAERDGEREKQVTA